VGKTTLARAISGEQKRGAHYFDLEDPQDLQRLAEPLTALEELRGLIVIDEIQRRPDLFPVLRVLADRRPLRARFLVLGSASPALLEQSTESLAGRISYQELHGFDLEEVGVRRANALWVRGGFPRSFLASSVEVSNEWRRDFLRTFLERELPQLGVRVPAPTIRRFWSMIAHSHGQLWNSSELARAFGVSDTAVRRYLDLLTATFMVRQLQPWRENLAKRQVKSPKIYVADSGLLHTLLGISDAQGLEQHPKVGASWEGFALEQVTRRLGARNEECYFWRTHAGAELDLLVVRGRHRFGYEFKRADAPGVTPSMRSALADLSLESLDVIYPGKKSYTLGDRVRVLPLAQILDQLSPL